MYKNIGNKIQFFAKLGAWLGIVACIFIGTVLVVVGIGNEIIEYTVMGVLTIIVGPFMYWYLSLTMCGYGQMIHDVQTIREMIEKNNQ